MRTPAVGAPSPGGEGRGEGEPYFLLHKYGLAWVGTDSHFGGRETEGRMLKVDGLNGFQTPGNDATTFRVGENHGTLTQGSDAKRLSVATLG